MLTASLWLSERETGDLPEGIRDLGLELCSHLIQIEPTPLNSESKKVLKC
jgi:hypothetical protein